MATAIQIQTKTLQETIYSEKYYIALWEAELFSSRITAESIAECLIDDNALVVLCHEFWSALPDTAEIRRPPFFALCNIAENILE